MYDEEGPDIQIAGLLERDSISVPHLRNSSMSASASLYNSPS